MTTRRTAKGALEPTGQSREGETPLPGSQQRILDAAVEAFAEQGYSGTVTSEIARRAGVAEGTILRYYPTKKAQEIAFHANLRAQFRQRIAAAIHPLLVRAIERMQERALIAPMAPSSVARIIISAVIGYLLPRVFLAPEAPWDAAAELDLLARVLGRGLAMA